MNLVGWWIDYVDGFGTIHAGYGVAVHREGGGGGGRCGGKLRTKGGGDSSGGGKPRTIGGGTPCTKAGGFIP